MLTSIEEEEFGNDEGLDQHDRGCSDDRKKSNYVDDTDCVQYDVASADQSFAEDTHTEESHGGVMIEALSSVVEQYMRERKLTVSRYLIVEE